jgi:hypothetical protein
MARRRLDQVQIAADPMGRAVAPESAAPPVQLWAVFDDDRAPELISSGAYDEVVHELYEIGRRHREGHPVTTAAAARLRVL